MSEIARDRRLKLYFGPFDLQRRPIMLAYVCGFGNAPEGGYIFVGADALPKLRAEGQQYFEPTDSLGESDIAIYPYNYQAQEDTVRFADDARGSAKPCVFFRNLDRPPSARLAYGLVYQESIFASRQTSCERPQPAAVPDLLDGRPCEPRRKQERPVVSFRGFQGTGGFREAMRWIVGGKEAYLGSFVRRKAIEACSRSDLLDARIELVRFDRGDVDRLAMRELYIRSILESDYVLCIRGAGNWSYRFYETLSAGRIPVFVNTDCCLPLNDTIAWRRHCVWIEMDELDRLPERICAFHDGLDDDTFRGLQATNRQLWVERLQPLAFWRQELRRLLDHTSRSE